MAGKTGVLFRDAWRGWRRGLIDVLFPRACVSCGAEMIAYDRSANERAFCEECLNALELFRGPACGRCGVQLGDISIRSVAFRRGGCVHCSGRKLWFDSTIAVGHYAGLLRKLLLRMKHANGQALSLAIGRLIAERYGEQLNALHADVVAPVPMHWRRRFSRGTNSAAVLAEVLAGRLRVPLGGGLLRRRRNTPPQFSLTPPQRWENVRRAFSVRAGYHLSKAHVLLVDDILTTGATCSAIARELRRARAARVTVVVAARAISELRKVRGE